MEQDQTDLYKAIESAAFRFESLCNEKDEEIAALKEEISRLKEQLRESKSNSR